MPAAPTTGVRIADPALGLSMVYTDTQGITTTITIPPNALANIDSMVFADRTFVLKAFRDGLPADDVVLDLPVTIATQYREPANTLVRSASANNAAPIDWDENSLQMMHWNGDAWVNSACGDFSTDTAANIVEVNLCELGHHALFSVDDVPVEDVPVEDVPAEQPKLYIPFIGR